MNYSSTEGYWAKQDVLVTGGAGFIGSHLCEVLSKNGANVVSLDNYFTGSTANHVDGVDYINGCTSEINSTFDKKFDLVFHLGEYSRVEQSFLDIETVWQSNTTGTMQVLKYCSDTHVKLIYAGSSTKFGDNGTNARESPYAWTKASNTELIHNFAKWYGLHFAIAYFYNAYGPRELKDGSYATLIARFAELWRKKEPLTVVRPGTQTRNFTHVEDIVQGLLLVAQYGEGDGYGIGSDDEYTVLQVAELFGGEIQFLSKRKGNRMNAPVQNDKIKQLGWKQTKYLPAFINEIKDKNV